MTNLSSSNKIKSYFQSKVSIDAHGCWNWKGALSVGGYGRLQIKRFKVYYAHRAAWIVLAGRKIPSGKQLDHICRNRRCANPDHLEAVTSLENTIRGNHRIARQVAQTECIHGHPFDKKNTYIHPIKKERHCRMCAKIYQQKRRDKKRTRIR